MSGEHILLSSPEIMVAALVGVMRQVQNLKKGRQDRYGCPTDMGWQTHLEGACGEMVVAKALGRLWSGNLGDLEMADVGSIQVRTGAKEHFRLILHEADADGDAFVLVTGTAPKYEIRGWILGSDGKKPEFWKDPAGGRPAFFVDQQALRPLDELRMLGDAAR